MQELSLPVADREERIRFALEKHHAHVSTMYRPVMTVLVGSQNYGLDMPDSDFDTCTFVLPNIRDIARMFDPVSIQQEDDLGHIVIKDIRLGLKLLKKTSPNSVEWFASNYRLAEPEYESLLRIPPVALRCNTRNMMNAIDGLAHQLQNRNMSPGKRLSHILRMECMIRNYFSLHSDLLSMTENERALAMRAKALPDDPVWSKECERHASIVHEAVKSADMDYFAKSECYVYDFLTDLQIKFVALAMKRDELLS